jgi:general secretion pathway protein B
MSYILEALKKSQQERELGQVPTLDATGLFVEDREPVETHHWALFAVGLAALAVVIALYAAFRGTGSGPAVPMTALEAPGVEPVPMVQSGVQPAVTQAPGPDPGTTGVAVRPLVEPPPPKLPPPRSTPPESTPVGRVAPPSQVVDPDVDPDWERDLLRQLEAEQAAMNAAREILEEPPRTAPVPDDLVQDIESFKQQVRREQGVAPPASQRKPVEIRSDPTRLKLTPQQQAAVPGYLMTVHVYDPDVAKRFVVINTLRYREGEETREGLRVERILKDGAVLSYLGNPFYVSR